MLKPDISQFIPRKYKKLKNNGLRVEWDIPTNNGEAEYADGFHKESNNIPHADLINLLIDINEPVKQIIQTDDSCPLYVSEISLAGEEGDESVQFSGYIKHKNGQKTTFKTPSIKLAEDTFGVESKIWVTLSNLKNEGFEYVFNDKYAQLRLFGSEEETDQQEEDID